MSPEPGVEANTVKQIDAVLPTDSEMKEMISISLQIYNDQNFKSDGLFEKCAYLLSAIYFNSLSTRIFMTSNCYLDLEG